MAGRELSKFEQDTLVEALTQIDEAGKKQKLAEYSAAIEQERAGRVAAESKVGELAAELAKRKDGYQSAIADMEMKLLQSRESRATSDMLSAQARTEVETERRKNGEFTALIQSLKEQIDALMQIEREEPQMPIVSQPPSYRVSVVARDAAGDLRTLELTPVERN